jgi:hypothetical protein
VRALEIVANPRKRQSTAQTVENLISTDWIPAFAGMTALVCRKRVRALHADHDSAYDL